MRRKRQGRQQGWQQERQRLALQAAAAAGVTVDAVQAGLHLRLGWLGLLHLQLQRAQPYRPGVAARLPPRLQGSHGCHLQRELLGCDGALPQPQRPEEQRSLVQQTVSLAAALRHLLWELLLAVGCLASCQLARQPAAQARAG